MKTTVNEAFALVSTTSPWKTASPTESETRVPSTRVAKVSPSACRIVPIGCSVVSPACAYCAGAAGPASASTTLPLRTKPLSLTRSGGGSAMKKSRTRICSPPSPTSRRSGPRRRYSAPRMKSPPGTRTCSPPTASITWPVVRPADGVPVSNELLSPRLVSVWPSPLPARSKLATRSSQIPPQYHFRISYPQVGRASFLSADPRDRLMEKWRKETENW